MRLISAAAVFVLATGTAHVFAQTSSPVRILDVPYIQQSEALCGGAAAAMVMRYWGATGVYAETFASLVDRSSGGIRAADLLDALRRRGWDARSFRGDAALVQSRLAAGQPLILLIEDRPGAFHFVVVVAWTKGRVVYHDPARAPFRVVDEDALDEAWVKSDRWTMLALPASAAASTSADKVDETAIERDTPAGGRVGAVTADGSICDALVEEGVRSAESGDRAQALRVFSAAADLCPEASSPLREAAGVHALDGDWAAAASRAREAVARDRTDEHAWRIVATSEYVRGDHDAALEAWNAIGEPAVDLVTVQGLGRTRHAVAAARLRITPGQPLTRRSLAAATRRLEELPSADVVRVSYTPQADGRANVAAVVVERPRLPISRARLAAIGVQMLVEREVAIESASMTGGGELLRVGWRWWEGRPRLSVGFAVPSPAGVWRVEGFGETQTYGEEGVALVEKRRGGSASLSNWTSSLLRWELGAGLDAWSDRGRTASVHAAAEQRLSDERISVQGRGLLFAGSFRGWSAGAAIEARTHLRNEGLVLSGRAGADAAAAAAPLALWPGAGTGHARGPLLRAHPLLDGGRITGDVFGRRVYHAGVETCLWMTPLFKVVRFAPAVFVDAARANRTLRDGGAWHVDTGVGLRIAAGGGNVLRLDVGKGLRDGATAFSIGWTR